MTSRATSFFSRRIELPIPTRERGQLYRWMAGMLRRGYSLPRILEALAGVSLGHRSWLLSLANQVREGIPLSQAMKKGGWGYAPPIVRELVATGEKRNVLAQALTLACELIDPERPSDQKADLKGLSIYFGAVLAITLMTVSVLLIFVVPVFAKMFAEFGGALPLPTQIIISFSTWMTKKYGLFYLLSGAAILVIGLWLALKRDRADQLLERLPWLGRVFRYSRWWKIAYGMGTLMQGGVPLDEALATLGKGLRMRRLAAAADRIAALLREGMEPADLLQDEKLFPSEIRWAVGLGETRKDLAASLIKVGIMNRELEGVFLSRLAILINAGIFLVIGVTIGFIVIALYWPIFNFGSLIY